MADTQSPSRGTADAEMTGNSLLKNWTSKASRYHTRVPYLNRLPFPALAIIITLIGVNLLVWAAVGIVLVRQSPLFPAVIQILIEL